jgi:peptidyl-prolyl cis-trans isomerase A (cyclophilin A)
MVRCSQSFCLSTTPIHHRPTTPNARSTLVKCHTTAANGAPFVIEVRHDWAPLGADRFLKLVQSGYFTGVPFFRVVPGFLTQFGITPDRKLRKFWREQGPIQDDPNEHRPIKRGYLSFAGGGPNTRDMQFFITYNDSDWLGKAPWEVPFGRVIMGMDEVIDRLHDVGEIHPFEEKGVKQGKIWEEGNEYLHREFPKVRPYFVCVEREGRRLDRADVCRVLACLALD